MIRSGLARFQKIILVIGAVLGAAVLAMWAVGFFDHLIEVIQTEVFG